MSENWQQSEICIVINDQSQDSTAKHLSYDGLLHYKFFSHCAGKRIFKIREHLAKLQAKWLIVSYAPFALASTPPGCRGHIPPIFWLGGCQREYPRQYYYVLLDIADQYWLPSVRSVSSRFHSAIRRHQFASVRQADSRLTRLVPPTLNSR